MHIKTWQNQEGIYLCGLIICLFTIKIKDTDLLNLYSIK